MFEPSLTWRTPRPGYGTSERQEISGFFCLLVDSAWSPANAGAVKLYGGVGLAGLRRCVLGYTAHPQHAQVMPCGWTGSRSAFSFRRTRHRHATQKRVGHGNICTNMSTLFVKLADELSVEDQRLIAEALRRIYGNKGPGLTSRQPDAADGPRSAARDRLHKASSRLADVPQAMSAFLATRELLNTQSGRRELARRAIERRTRQG